MDIGDLERRRQHLSRQAQARDLLSGRRGEAELARQLAGAGGGDDVRGRQAACDRAIAPLDTDAQATIETWPVDYNALRPNSALHGQAPWQFSRDSTGFSGYGPLAQTKPVTAKDPHYPCSGS